MRLEIILAHYMVESLGLPTNRNALSFYLKSIAAKYRTFLKKLMKEGLLVSLLNPCLFPIFWIEKSKNFQEVSFSGLLLQQRLQEKQIFTFLTSLPPFLTFSSVLRQQTL